MKKKLLVIDDELDLLEIMNDSLTRFGHDSLCLTSPLQGLRAFYENKNEFSCIIVDYQIPDLTGVEFALQIMEMSPDMPIILTTGFADKKIQSLLSIYPNIHLLEKPFRLDELIFLVTQIATKGQVRVSA